MRSRTDAVGEVREAGQDRGQGRGVRRWGFSLGSPVASLLVLHPTVPLTSLPSLYHLPYPTRSISFFPSVLPSYSSLQPIP